MKASSKNIRIDTIFLHDFAYIDNPKEINDLLLYQLGEIFCDKNAIIDPHVHDDFFEVSYITSGNGMFISNGVKQIVKKGDLFLSLPNENHEIISDSYDPLRYYYTAFSFKQGSRYRDIIYNNIILNLEPSNRIYHTKNLSFNQTFSKLISSYESEEKYSITKFELLMKILCIDLHDIFLNISELSYNSPIISNEEDIYYSITKYIDKNLLTISNLNEIADALNHNYSYLSRIFKKKFGQTMYDYYSLQKLNYAKKLIEENEMTLTKISSYLNYTSVYVFSRAFKNAFGISPKAYKDSLN